MAELFDEQAKIEIKALLKEAVQDKRFEAAKSAMQAIRSSSKLLPKDVALMAIADADALLAELERTEKRE